MSHLMRQEFEEWFVHNYSYFIDKGCSGYELDLPRNPAVGQYYRQSRANHDYRVWIASRQHHIIKLPQEENPGLSADISLANEAIDVCESILRDKGFGVTRK